MLLEMPLELPHELLLRTPERLALRLCWRGQRLLQLLALLRWRCSWLKFFLGVKLLRPLLF